MKKLIVLLVATVFAGSAWAQEERTSGDAEDHPANHECYMMKDNKMIHCMGKTDEAMAHDAKLNNGFVVTTAGQVVMPKGRTTQMKNGQCIDLTGMLMDCGEMHENLKSGDNEDEDNEATEDDESDD